VSCAIVVGFLWALLRTDAILTHDLNRKIEGETVIVTGQVMSLPEILDSGVRFEFKINEMQSQNGDILRSPGKVRLGWYREAVTIQPG
jgi:competence protein ComEC